MGEGVSLLHNFPMMACPRIPSFWRQEAECGAPQTPLRNAWLLFPCKASRAPTSSIQGRWWPSFCALLLSQQGEFGSCPCVPQGGRAFESNTEAQ